MESTIIDECSGKQIDYYNQLPNSFKAIEDILERLEKAESQKDKYKNYIFQGLKDCSIEECCVELEGFALDDSIPYRPAPRELSFGAKINIKIDKDNNKILLDFERDDDHYKYDEYITRYKRVWGKSNPAVIDINDDLIYFDQSDTHGGLYISFKNEHRSTMMSDGTYRELKIGKISIPYAGHYNLLDVDNFDDIVGFFTCYNTL